MSFVPSIGDVVLAIQILIDVYNKVQDAPSEVDAAIQDVKRIKAELESMRDKVGDEKYFIKKNGEAMLATITDTFVPLKDDLKAMKQLLKKYSKIPPWSGQKIIFAVFKIPDVKRLQESFNNYRAIYSRAFEHAGASADAHNAEELKAINRRLEAKNKQLAVDFAELKKQQKRATEMQKESNAKMDEVLSLIGKLAVSPAPSASSKTFSKVELEDQLVASGLQRDEAKKVMGPLIWTSQDVHHGAPPVKITGHGIDQQDNGAQGQIRRNRSQNSVKKPSGLKAPRKPTGRARSVSQSRDDSNENSPSLGSAVGSPKSPSPVRANLKTPSSATLLNNKPPSPSKKQETRDTAHIWILCVDRTNGFQSILAQTYLELLRLWTANTTPMNATSPSQPRWLFARVSSVGLNLPSQVLNLANSLIQPSNPQISVMAPASTPSPAIHTLTKDPSYFRSTDYPQEKTTLVSRMSNLQQRGISAPDFETYHYMLCFDPSVASDLARMKSVVEDDFKKQYESAKTVKGKQGYVERSAISQIHTLPSSEWFQESIHTSPAEMTRAVSNIRDSLIKFATTELGWERPVNFFAKGQWRTLQIVLPFKYRAMLLEKIGTEREKRRKGRVEGVPEMEDVTIRVTWQGGKEREQLVSVTGPKERLKAAEGWIRGLC